MYKDVKRVLAHLKQLSQKICNPKLGIFIRPGTITDSADGNQSLTRVGRISGDGVCQISCRPLPRRVKSSANRWLNLAPDKVRPSPAHQKSARSAGTIAQNQEFIYRMVPGQFVYGIIHNSYNTVRYEIILFHDGWKDALGYFCRGARPSLASAQDLCTNRVIVY